MINTESPQTKSTTGNQDGNVMRAITNHSAVKKWDEIRKGYGITMCKEDILRIAQFGITSQPIENNLSIYKPFLSI